ncbi:MAG: hypothetical protein MUF86_11375 [Akkermansiaceae bacterium]|jgi:hypothetical protein|nr:hypothetical protein [Akkermansiaceae bacterium]MCU0778253.1 hypothetical protein [Akkermansiaceae bacterium]
MAAPTLQEILLGGYAFFIPSGVSSASATSKPSSSPLTPWTDGTLGTVLNFKFGNEELDSSFLRPLPFGGHEKVNRKFVVQDFVMIQTREMSELVHRLQHGLSAAINEGTAQTPGLAKDRKIEGWLRLQGRALGGFDRFILDWWSECRLEGENVFDEKVVTPTLRFTMIKVVANVAVAGNSTNFPAQA